MANGNSDEENWEKIEKENEEDDPKLVEGDEEEGWVKIYVVDCEELDVQTNKIDKENDDGHQEVKDCEKIDDDRSEIDEENDFEDGEEEEEKIDDDRSENIDKENEDEDGEEEEEEKIDDRSEKIGNDAGVVKVEECLEFDYGNRNRDYWERNWNHWIYKRERMIGADYPSFCSYGPISIDDPFKWQAVILGPPNSPYEDGFFFLAIDLPSDYPISPPTITFKTKVFHPNIDEDGNIYVNILEKEEWSPIQTIESLLISICSLLADPDPVDPTFDWETYVRKSRKWTKTYAM